VSASAPLSSLFAGFSFWTAEAPKASSPKKSKKKN
jgi:hypothetical protein